jgi:hypothetical protein
MENNIKTYIKKIKKIKRFLIVLFSIILFIALSAYSVLDINLIGDREEINRENMATYNINKGVVGGLKRELNRVVDGGQIDSINYYQNFFNTIEQYEGKDNPFVDFLIVK